MSYNDTTLNDKVKLLSVTELGLTNSGPTEGYRYKIYLYDKGASGYWTRSTTGSSDIVMSIGKGYAGYEYAQTWLNHTYSFGLAPCIRLG